MVQGLLLLVLKMQRLLARSQWCTVQVAKGSMGLMIMNTELAYWWLLFTPLDINDWHLPYWGPCSVVRIEHKTKIESVLLLDVIVFTVTESVVRWVHILHLIRAFYLAVQVYENCYHFLLCVFVLDSYLLWLAMLHNNITGFLMSQCYIIIYITDFLM